VVRLLRAQGHARTDHRPTQQAVNEILAMPSIEKQLIREGADPVGRTPAEFGQFVQREFEKWKLIVRESGATPE
jgi:tripartite-type tricarboxylate transporter receptor subunit TctC